MNPAIIKKIEHEIGQILNGQSDRATFDLFLEAMERFYQKPAHSLIELKERDSTKIRGDIFEHFCFLYLTRVLNWQVWFLKDLPIELSTQFGLKKHDLGIDLIGFDKNRYYAIQAKYRTRNVKNYRGASVLSWKQLSTFYALAQRTGPYHQHWVMTTADYVRHVGNRSDKDRSLCYRTFKGLNREKWLKILGNSQTYILDSSTHSPTSEIDQKEFIRKQRLKFFDQST